jgi:hypothetical protein
MSGVDKGGPENARIGYARLMSFTVIFGLGGARKCALCNYPGIGSSLGLGKSSVSDMCPTQFTCLPRLAADMGCRATVRLDPPSSTLAPSPAPPLLRC